MEEEIKISLKSLRALNHYRARRKRQFIIYFHIYINNVIFGLFCIGKSQMTFDLVVCTSNKYREVITKLEIFCSKVIKYLHRKVYW